MAEIDKNSFGFLSQCVVSFMCFLFFPYEKEVLSSVRQFGRIFGCMYVGPPLKMFIVVLTPYVPSVIFQTSGSLVQSDVRNITKYIY